MHKFLNICAEVEETVAQIYHEFASNPQSDAALVRIWKDLAKEEEAHAQQLKLAMRLPVKHVFNGLSKGTPSPEELHQVALDLLKKARGGEMGLLDMLKSAVLLEKEFRKVHATCSLQFKDESLKATFTALAKADADHLAALDDYLTKFKKKHAPASKG